MNSLRFIYLPFLILFLALSHQAFAQEEEPGARNTVALGIGHTMVGKGVKDGSKKWLSLPSWAIDYNFKITESWTIGLQNEIILSDFEVETFETSEVITRTNPFSSIVVVGYHPLEALMLFVGGGAEFAAEENFVMLRVGAEPSFEINDKFELVAGLTYDFKVDGYDSFGLSLGVGYKF